MKLEYQLSRAIFFRYVGQYFAQDQVALQDPRTAQPILAGGAPAAAVVTNDFRNDLLFSYKPLPGTLVFLGYGTSLTEPEAFRFQNLSRASDDSCPSRGGSSSGSQPHSRLRTTRCTGSPATSRSDPGTSTSTSRSAPR